MKTRAAPRLRVLVSAYACEPDRGSEPAVGWSAAVALSRDHDLWVLTRANQREAIERGLAQLSPPLPRFVYLDLPPWARLWKRGSAGVALYYYLWQFLAYRAGRALHRELGFDLAHHVTFVKYSAPSLLVRLPIPLIWGPVGGGECAPAPFVRELRWRGRAHNRLRRAVRWLAERDPLVLQTARGAAVALAATQETAARLRALGAPRVEVLSQVGADGEAVCASRPPRAAQPFRVVSAGRLLEFKGVHLGLRAFARASVPQSQYWILGDGPELARLRRLARELGLADRVQFFGALPRERVREIFGHCHLLLHASLHESGGLVCSEAMSAGCPVAALGLGGPALQVPKGTGVLVPASDPQQAVTDLADAIALLAGDVQTWQSYSTAALEHARGDGSWSRKSAVLSALYRGVASEGRGRAR